MSRCPAMSCISGNSDVSPAKYVAPSPRTTKPEGIAAHPAERPARRIVHRRHRRDRGATDPHLVAGNHLDCLETRLL